MKKDVKKSSYYVWFLGAQECKNVRDVESVIPVISLLAEREKKVAPYKFTLQVSHRGLKIVHNVSALSSLPGGKSSKSDLVKHLIPDHAVTCVHRDEDLVAVILLLYNPVTKWPVHVHVYRCDSVETATLLSSQLQMLIDRPENKKKLDETESRLARATESVGRQHCCAAEPRKIRDSTPPPPPLSSSSESGTPGVGGNITTLYDSLAAELKKKLGTGSGKTGAPILLPPRDYDTVHRHRGNLNGIDFRRCMSTNIVGVNVAKQDFRRSTVPKIGSSGGSSGIGSDHAPSPEQYEPENAYADNNSSSDEDWNASPLEEPLFAKPVNDHPLPRIRRQDSGVDSGSSPLTSPEKDYYGRQQADNNINKNTHFRRPDQNIAPNLREKYSDRNVALVQPRLRTIPTVGAVSEFRRKPTEIRQRTPSPSRPTIKETPRERFKDAKEKFLMLEKERIDEQQSAMKMCLERQRSKDAIQYEKASPAIRAVVKSSCNWSKSHGSDEEIDRPIRYANDDDFEDKRLKNVRRSNRSRESLDNDYNAGYSKPISSRRSRNSQQDNDEPRPAPRSYSADDYLEHNFRSPPPEDRYKEHNFRPPPEDRYKSPQRRVTTKLPEVPRAAPRRNHFSDGSPTASPSRVNNDYKRRSAAYSYEDGGSGRHEPSLDNDGLPLSISREYKRRSAAYTYEDPYHQNQHHQDHNGGYNKREMIVVDKLQRPAASEDTATASPVSPRYRHSYAEAYHRHNNHHHHHQQQQQPQASLQDPVYRGHGSNNNGPLLQSSGRIGIAAIHPY